MCAKFYCARSHTRARLLDHVKTWRGEAAPMPRPRRTMTDRRADGRTDKKLPLWGASPQQEIAIQLASGGLRPN